MRVARRQDGHGKRGRASTGSSLTLCRSASPDPSAERVARATFTAGLRCSMALRSKVSPQGARARFAGARASRLHGSGPSSLWLRAIRLTGAQGRARAVRAPNRGSGHLAAAGWLQPRQTRLLISHVTFPKFTVQPGSPGAAGLLRPGAGPSGSAATVEGPVGPAQGTPLRMKPHETA